MEEGEGEGEVVVRVLQHLRDPGSLLPVPRVGVHHQERVAAELEAVGQLGGHALGAVLREPEGGEVGGGLVVRQVLVVARNGRQRDRAPGVAQGGEERVPLVRVIAAANEVAAEDQQVRLGPGPPHHVHHGLEPVEALLHVADVDEAHRVLAVARRPELGRGRPARLVRADGVHVALAGLEAFDQGRVTVRGHLVHNARAFHEGRVGLDRVRRRALGRVVGVGGPEGDVLLLKARVGAPVHGDGLARVLRDRQEDPVGLGGGRVVGFVELVVDGGGGPAIGRRAHQRHALQLRRDRVQRHRAVDVGQRALLQDGGLKVAGLERRDRHLADRALRGDPDEVVLAHHAEGVEPRATSPAGMSLRQTSNSCW